MSAESSQEDLDVITALGNRSGKFSTGDVNEDFRKPTDHPDWDGRLMETGNL
jgi:hypothetical protein